MIRVMMMALIMLLLSVPSASAQKSGDMFNDSYMVSSDRPYIEGDRSRHADFFPPYEPYIRSDKDMFDQVHMTPGVNDMFTNHIHAAPDQKIYNWPDK